MGIQVSTEELMNTMPLRETVAGEALSMLCGSNTTLQLGAIGIRSPFASVRVLLSSKTEFRFSIQMASTGPSSTIQMCSPVRETKCLFTWLRKWGGMKTLCCHPQAKMSYISEYEFSADKRVQNVFLANQQSWAISLQEKQQLSHLFCGILNMNKEIRFSSLSSQLENIQKQKHKRQIASETSKRLTLSDVQAISHDKAAVWMWFTL